MFYRRKILLALLELFEGQLTTEKLQLLLFLLTRGQEKRDFDFIPSQKGPYSFQAAQDISTMMKYGYFKISNQDEGTVIKLIQQGDYIADIKTEDQKLLTEVKTTLGALSQDELIKHIFIEYPYYGINSPLAMELLDDNEIIIIKKQKQTINIPTLFSIGYEGISLEEYINKLIKNDVHVLCDVRKNAFSQKFGFSKNQLSNACEVAGVKYVHIPELGIESEKRKELNRELDLHSLFEDYLKHTLPKNKDSLYYVREIIDKYKRVALTCFEKDPNQCHRTCVAEALMEMSDWEYEYKIL